MSGVLSMLLAGGVTTSTFNIVAGVLAGSVLVGYSDGTAGMDGSAGSISGSSSFGGKTISEIAWDNSTLNVDRLRVKGFSTNPGSGWLKSVTANGHTRTGASATFTWDSVNNVAKWEWATGSFGFTSSNTYNGNTITHNA